ncbi:hypothetical protein MMC07_009583 [Pseudocyphellaria aurata]|nr:hypothetical protein [Pseudocyphellaria aurata]
MSPSIVENDSDVLDLVQMDSYGVVGKQQAELWAKELYPPSVASIESLNKVSVMDMILNSRNPGSYVLVRLTPTKTLPLGLGVGADETGNMVGIQILPQDGQQVYNEYLGGAEFLIIKEPLYIAYPKSSAGYVSVYHISDVVALLPGDPRIPQGWKSKVQISMKEWRLAGNQAVREKNFYDAITCYNEALFQARSQDDRQTLILNRCHARISIQCFDTALEDANAVLKHSANNEKALFRKAEALYHLRQFKDAQKTLDHLTTVFPDNKMAHQRSERVRDRLQEEAGNYDFPAMLEGTSQPTRVDRASFIGCVEVRPCKVTSRGRGLFLTKPVKLGELLLCEKAFAVSLMSIHENIERGLPGHGLDTARDDMYKDCVFQLHRNPSRALSFSELHSGGSKAKETIVDGQRIIDGFMIDSIVALNCYKFPQSRDYHNKFLHADPDLEDYPRSAGVWVLASYINHSCLPNVERAFIGDMIVIRAAQNLAAGSELTLSYISILGGIEERQNSLKVYGFQCDCRRCQIDMDTPPACHLKRDRILNDLEVENSTLAMVDSKVAFKNIESLLDEFDATFNLPPPKIPRTEVYMELYITILNLHRWDRLADVVTTVHRLLKFSGYHVRVSKTKFRIAYWGSVNDFTVMGLAYLWKAYGTVNPLLCDDVEEALKMAYEVEVGERTSFEGVYGDFRPTGKADSAGTPPKAITIMDYASRGTK